MRTVRTMVTLAIVGLTTYGVRAQQPLTVRGEVVEVSCYSKLGVDKATGAAHVACAKECVSKGQALAILTDGDGLLKVTGDYAANNYAKLVAFVGRQVEVTGTPDRYLDYSRAIRVGAVKPIAAGSPAR